MPKHGLPDRPPRTHRFQPYSPAGPSASRNSGNARTHAHSRVQTRQGEKPSLEQRLAAAPQPPTPAPIAPRSTTIDFQKYTPADLARIYAPKFEATLKRLDIFETLEFGDIAEIFPQRVKNLHALINQITRIKRCLTDVARVVKYNEWQEWDIGCKEIGEVSFKGLRKNKGQIIKALSAVYERGRFDAIDY